MSYKLVEMQKLAIYWIEMKHSETFSNLPFFELAVSTFANNKKITFLIIIIFLTECDGCESKWKV